MCTCACVIYYLYILRRFRKLDITSKISKIPLWGQFLPRPSVAFVVIFGLESPTLEEKPWKVNQTSGTLQPLVIPYKA